MINTLENKQFGPKKTFRYKVFDYSCHKIGKEENVPTIYLPIAHGEGKFVTKDETTLNKIMSNQQVVFKYINECGEEAGYPWNLGGSLQKLGGIWHTTGK